MDIEKKQRPSVTSGNYRGACKLPNQIFGRCFRYGCANAPISPAGVLGANAGDQPCARADHLGVGAAPQTVRPQNAFWMHGSPTTKSSGSAKLSRLCSGGICSQVA